MTWTRVPLKKIGRWYGGGTPSKSNAAFWRDGTIPWLSPKDMGPSTIIGTQDHITPAAVAESTTNVVPAGSVAVVVRSGILERTLPIGLVPFETTLNQDMKAVVPREGIDVRWVAWGLRAFERDLLRDTRKAGTTVASIEMPRFHGFELPVPALAEQRRIVDILEDHLSRLDAAEAYSLSAARRSQTLMQSQLNSVGSGPYVPLSHVADIQGGVQKQPKRAPRSNAFPFLRVANVTANGLNLADVHKIELFDAELDRLRLRPNDLLVVEGNGSPSQIGRAALWDGSIKDCVHQNHLIRVRAREGLLPEYLESIWSSPRNRQVLTEVSSSSSGLHTLSVRKLQHISIPLPSMDEQRGRADAARSAREAHGRVSDELETARARSQLLRRALLTAAFSGNLTGRHTDQEVIETAVANERAVVGAG